MAIRGDEGAAGINSDDFSTGTLLADWTEKAEGTASYALVGNETIDFTLPGTEDFDWWAATTSFYGITQTLSTDESFEIEAGFTTWGTEHIQFAGVGMYDSVYTQGGARHVFSYEAGDTHSILSYDATEIANDIVSDPTTGFRLRLGYTKGATQAQNVAYAEYSIDGAAWTTSWASGTWDVTPDTVCICLGRVATAATFVAKADYFWETSAPITGGPPPRRVMVR